MRRYLSFLSFLLVASLCLLPALATGEPLSVPVDHFTSFVGHADLGGAVLAMPAAAVPKGTLGTLKAKIKQALGIGDDRDAEVDALLAAELSEIEVTPTPQPSQQPAPPVTTGSTGDLAAAIQQALAPLQAQIKTVGEALASEKQAREAAQQALEAHQATERTSAITKALDDAVKVGKIAPAKRDDWKARLEKDFDGVNAILGELPGNPALAKQAAPSKTERANTTPATTTAPAATPTPGSMMGSLKGDARAYVTGEA